VGHERNAETEYAREADTGAPFTPYCVPMAADRVAAMLAEIRQAIDTLAAAEGWPDTHRAHLLDILRRQPAYTLADDLAHFRQRLDALRAADRAVEILVRTCGTCAHRTEHDHGARVRCAMARALDWRHHDWLDTPVGPNDCGFYQRDGR